MGMGLMSVLFAAYILVFVALGVWLIHSIWRAVTLPKRATKVPACEVCRYAVAGLGTMQCPECGSDLRLTGIVTPAMEIRRRGSTASAVIAWTVLWIFGGLIAVWLYSMVGVRQMLANGASTTSATVFLTPTSRAYSMLTLTSTQTMQFNSGATSSTVVGSIPGRTAGVSTIEISGPPFQAVRTDPAGTVTPSAPLATSEIDAWMRAAGIDTSSQQSQVELTEVLNVANSLASAPASPVGAPSFTVKANPVQYNTTGMGTGGGTSWATVLLPWILLGVWVLLYGLVIWLIVRRRRSLMKRFAPAPALSAARADEPTPAV